MHFYTLVLCGFLASGCSRHSKVPSVIPITDTQAVFFEIKELHNRNESERLIQRGEMFIETEPPAELARPVLYYVAYHLAQVGELNLSRLRYKEIIETYPDTAWSKLAKVNLRRMEETGR